MEPVTTTHVIDLLRTVLMTGAVLSLVAGLFPMLWGQVRIGWLVNGLTSCVLFGLAGMLLAVVGGSPGHAGHPIDPATMASLQEVGGLGIASLLVLAIAWFAGRYVVRARRRRLDERRIRDEARRQASDPVEVARKTLPDMTRDVELAMSRVARLQSLSGRISTPEDADALALVNQRLPSVMDLYRTAAEASTDEERSQLARTALSSVVDIGRAAEEARSRIAEALRTDLSVATRYISTRTCDVGDLHAD